MSKVSSTQTELTDPNKVKLDKAIKHLESICEWSLYRDHPIGMSAKQALDLLLSLNNPPITNYNTHEKI